EAGHAEDEPRPCEELTSNLARQPRSEVEGALTTAASVGEKVAPGRYPVTQVWSRLQGPDVEIWRSYEASRAVVLHAAHRVRVRRMRHDAVDPVVARRELSGSLRPDQRGEAARCCGTGLLHQAGHDYSDGGCEVAVRRLQPGRAVCAPSHRVAGFTQQVACDETRPRSKAAGRTRSVVGPGGVGRVLLDGDVERRGRASRCSSSSRATGSTWPCRARCAWRSWWRARCCWNRARGPSSRC